MTSDNMNAGQNRKSIYEYIIWMLHRLLADMRKNFVLLAACFVVISGTMIFLNSRKSDTYHASFTVVYEELVRKVYGDRLLKLNTLLIDNKTKAGSLLGLDDGAIKSLKAIEGTNILGEDLSEDMNTDRIPFIVNIYVTDTTYIPAIQKGIVNFLENGNSFLIDKRELKIKETEEELAFIEKQLQMMDSLKRKYDTRSSSKEAEKSPISSLYQLSYDLYKKKQALVKQREMPLNIYVIDDAIVPVSSKNSTVLVTLISFVVSFIVYLGILYLLIPAIRYKEA